MGFYVFMLVAFRCDSNDGVAALARKHLGILGVPVVAGAGKEWDWPRREDLPEHLHLDHWEAICFLTDLAGRSGGNKGPKGGTSSWGTVGNGTDPQAFVDVLRPFWMDLLGGGPDGEIAGGPLDFEHVIVFGEREQSARAHAWEISRREDPSGGVLGELLIEEKTLPFCWNQY
jgi:hypothetical protein